MASLTRALLIRPSLNRFSTSSELLVPEQYQAMDTARLWGWLNSGSWDVRDRRNMQSFSAGVA